MIGLGTSDIKTIKLTICKLQINNNNLIHVASAFEVDGREIFSRLLTARSYTQIFSYGESKYRKSRKINIRTQVDASLV